MNRRKNDYCENKEEKHKIKMRNEDIEINRIFQKR